MLDKDSEIVPLTCKDNDAMRIYEASLRFLVAMAMHNIHPHYEIRFAYNVSRSIFLQILNKGYNPNISPLLFLCMQNFESFFFLES